MRYRVRRKSWGYSYILTSSVVKIETEDEESCESWSVQIKLGRDTYLDTLRFNSTALHKNK